MNLVSQHSEHWGHGRHGPVAAGKEDLSLEATRPSKPSFLHLRNSESQQKICVQMSSIHSCFIKIGFADF